MTANLASKLLSKWTLLRQKKPLKVFKSKFILIRQMLF